MTDVRLFSPQTFHQMHGGHSEVHGDRVEILLDHHTIVIPINREQTNLPVIQDSWLTSKEKQAYGTQMKSALSWSGLYQLNFFNNEKLEGSRVYLPIEREVYSEFDRFSNLGSPCIGQDSNTNLSGPQKELILWHWKLGIRMFRIQEMMREQKLREPLGETS